MNVGDLYWVNLPDSGGREQRGRRPAIIWQDCLAFPGLPTVLTIPLTSQLGASRFPATVRIEPSAANGLTVPSIALIFQMSSCDIRRVEERLGKLDGNDFDRVRDMVSKLQRISPK